MLTDPFKALVNNPFKEKFYGTQKKKKNRFFNLSSKLRKSRYGWNSQPNAVSTPAW